MWAFILEMEISLMQGILIGLVTAFCYSGMLLGIYTNRAIVMAFFVGLILGDIPIISFFFKNTTKKNENSDMYIKLKVEIDE